MLALGAALAVQFWLTRVVGSQTPFVSISGAVIVASWCAGLVGGLLATTERRRAEKKLRAEEARYHSLVRATSQIVWTATRDGQVVDDSPTWRKHTGQRLEEMQGSGWIDAIHPEDRDEALKVWNGAVETAVYEAESRVRAADGNYGDFRVCGVPVLEPDGSVRAYVVRGKIGGYY